MNAKQEMRFVGMRGFRLTGHRCVESKGFEAGQLFAPGVLHVAAEDVLPGVQLQQLDALQDLCGLLQPICGVFLRDAAGSTLPSSLVTIRTNKAELKFGQILTSELVFFIQMLTENFADGPAF